MNQVGYQLYVKMSAAKLKVPLFFFLILIFQLQSENLFSQDAQSKPTKESSLEAFSQGKYENAYSQFRELLLIYNKDPLYKYYAGVCLVKLNRNPHEAESLLQQAIETSGSLKSLPADDVFYLARAQQMSGKFDEAIKKYNAFSESAGKKTAQEMKVPEYISQCNQKKGKSSDSENPAEINVKNEPAPKSVKSDPVSSAVAVTAVSSAAKENLPAGYDKVLSEAIAYQYSADSLMEIVKGQKRGTGNYNSDLKTSIGENERMAASFQARADAKYQEAQDISGSVNSGSAIQKSAVVPIYTSAKDKDANPIAAKTTFTQDTVKTATHPVTPQFDIFSFFDANGKPVTDPKAKIVIDPEVPPGLIYRIQVAVFRKPVLPSYFKGLTPVYGFTVEGTDKIIYYVGMFRKGSDASKALSAVKSKGFKDSFVVPLSANKRVSSDRAASQEKEWGTKPFYSIEKALTKNETDTVTQTLAFRVEVERSPNPLTDEYVAEIRKMAGSRGLDMIKLQTGEISYLIGKFITFESAAEYADLLKRNGYRESQVAAWMGRKEIPVDTARKLFENLK
jgi:hypothetical protein